VTARDELTYVFLDPDGTQGAGVVVVVQAPTGVVYASQVGGHANEERTVEGFAVPLFHPLEKVLRTVPGAPPDSAAGHVGWKDADVQALAELVRSIPLWHTGRNADEPACLELDPARLSDLTEGWIPVLTAYGPGILTHQNGD